MTTNRVYQLCVDIIGFPRTTSEKQNVSFYSLLKKSGYFEMRDQTTIAAIREALLEQPDYVNDWIQYSEDQRCHPSWFFRQNGADYEVGFLSLEAHDVPVTKYSDRFEACATFIKHLIEMVRQIR